jgi:Pyruvate/2-oxoacid:ferredoxin oxidoreductase delta subunit
MSKPTGGKVTVDQKECKGCGLCVAACPPKCLLLLPSLNAYGVHPAHYSGENCTACSICFYVCPEPGAITIYRRIAPQNVVSSLEANHAPTL